MTKARLTRRRFVSIPQIEHFAAVLAVNIFALIKERVINRRINRIFLDRSLSYSGVYTPFPNLFAVTTCHMKARPYLVNCKQTDVRM